MEAIREWISVKDQVPVDNQRVIIHRDSINPELVIQCVKWSATDVVDMKVTHWMPLPDAPK